MRFTTSAALASLLVSPLHAQEAPQPDQAASSAPNQRSIEQFPPQMRAGIRSELARRNLPVIPTLVLVSNTADYLNAIAGWSLKGRFPILIDDGSVESRENIAGFARGFKPTSVVRWSTPAPKPADATQPTTTPPALTPDHIKSLAHTAIARAWDFNATDDQLAPLLEHWTQKLGLIPAGIVVADPNDPAWPSAVALAAGHGQPICWMDLPMGYRVGPDGLFQVTELDPIDTNIQKFAESTNLPWRDFGDAIDAVALCLNIASRGQIPGAKPYDMFTVSYRIGRTGSPPAYTDSRWASTSQIFGNESTSAYRAMCSLFLQPRRAWLFDGYENKEPFSNWDCTKASQYFEEAKFDVFLTDEPKNSGNVWRTMASRPIPAGVVMVNSSGERDDFNLQPGKLRSADTPFTDEPAMVYFVHSWSATLPASRSTVAGRWLDHGAYAYFGSAQEPYLQSFVNTPNVTGRILSSIPWAVATRYDEAINQVPVWKLSCFGDPLLTLGPPAAKARIELPLEGAINIQDALAPALKDNRFAEAISTLALLSRDEDAAKLAAALIEQKPDQFTPEAAAASIMPLFRTARADLLFKAYDVAITGRSLPPPSPTGEAPSPRGGEGSNDATPPGDTAARSLAQRSKPVPATDTWRDALWLAAYPVLYTKSDRLMLESLKNALRVDNFERDCDELATAWTRAYSKASAAAMLTEVVTAAPTPDLKTKARVVLQKYQGP